MGLSTVSDPLLPAGDQCGGGPTLSRLSLSKAGGAGLGWGSTAGVKACLQPQAAGQPGSNPSLVRPGPSTSGYNPQRRGQEATLLGDLVGEKVGNRARKETWRRTKREDVQRRDEGDIGLAGGPQSPVSLLLSDTPDPYFSSFSSPWVSGWKCCKCDMRENLWLNLTDGSILCGRRYFDGSGGNNHAVEHYRETGYPLAVKLGTITPDGAGTPSLPPAISMLKYV